MFVVYYIILKIDKCLIFKRLLIGIKKEDGTQAIDWLHRTADKLFYTWFGYQFIRHFAYVDKQAGRHRHKIVADSLCLNVYKLFK